MNLHQKRIDSIDLQCMDTFISTFPPPHFVFVFLGIEVNELIACLS